MDDKFYRKVFVKLEVLCSISRSFYVSWRLTSFREALRLPVVVRHNVLLRSLRGKLVRKGKGRLFIGFGNVGLFDKYRDRSILQIDGQILMDGNSRFGHGAKLVVLDSGTLVLGSNVVNSAEAEILCEKRISIGSNVTIAWDTLIIDSDRHQIENVATGEVQCGTKEISIDDNVWIGARAVVLKGSHLAEGTIVGANSTVAGHFDTPDCIIAGNPAKVVKVGVRKKS